MRVEPPLPVIVNRSGGTASAEGAGLAERIEEAFARVGSAIRLALVEPGDFAAAVRRCAGSPRVVVGGGDGTIGTAAGIVAGWGGEFAVLPLGTRNHFARQLGVPLDLDEAATLAASGKAVPVDLGAAGQRTFVNNASLGIYVELVRQREVLALPKWLGSWVAGWRVLRQLRPQWFVLRIDGCAQRISTAMLFVGNNRYELSEGRPAERGALDRGLLSLFALAPLSRMGVVRAALRVALGFPDFVRDFSLETTAAEITIEGEGDIGVALDGERLRLALPLTLSVRPGALKVVAPHA